MSDTPFAADFRALLTKHGINAPRFAYGRAFDPAKPQCLYSGPVFDQDELVAATSTLCEGKWSVAGENVHRFEGMFSRYQNQAESCMVNSGSSADLLLVAATKARFGWKDGDGVIVSTLSFPTTVSAIILNGLKPVFVDIEWETLNADNGAIDYALGAQEWSASVTNTIRAIFVSPVLGNPPDIDRLVALSERYGVKLLLDGCDSLGTTWRDKHLAEYATVTSCSFFPSHHASTLQGGMISSNDTELIRIARQMASWGRACYCTGAANLLPNGVCGCRFKAWLPALPDVEVDHKYVYETAQAYNLQPLDIQGAIGCVQMGKLEAIHMARRKAWTRLLFIWESTRLYEECDTARMWSNASDPSWFGFSIICPNYAYKRALQSHLEVAGIQTRNAFAGHILQQPGYAHLGRAEDYPNACDVLRRVFFIGANPSWQDAHFTHIESTLKTFTPPTT